MWRIKVIPRSPSGAGRLQDRAFAQPHFVEGLLGAGVDKVLGAFAEQVRGKHRRRHRRAHQEIDRPRHLVVAVGGVELDAVL
jgi:hypothetical protein